MGEVELSSYSIFAIIGLLGGAVGYLMKLSAGYKFRWIGFLAAIISSSFVGLLVGMGCKSLGLDKDMSYMIVGTAGWVGAEYIRTVVTAKLELLLNMKDKLPKDWEK